MACVHTADYWWSQRNCESGFTVSPCVHTADYWWSQPDELAALLEPPCVHTADYWWSQLALARQIVLTPAYTPPITGGRNEA